EKLECLRPTQRRKPIVTRHRALRHQRPEARYRGDVTHRFVVAELTLTAQKSQPGQARQHGETIGRQSGDVPEEAEPEYAVESRKSGQPLARDGAIQQEVIGLALE